MTIINEGIRLSKDEIEAGFFSQKDNGKSQLQDKYIIKSVKNIASLRKNANKLKFIRH
jgi:hypothetical protein